MVELEIISCNNWDKYPDIHLEGQEHHKKVIQDNLKSDVAAGVMSEEIGLYIFI